MACASCSRTRVYCTARHRTMAWIVCIGVVLAAVCLLQANCQKDGTALECSAQESGTVRFYSNPRVFDNRTEGQVLVCENGFWSRICDTSDGWTEEDAKVVCRELGFNAGEPKLILNQLWPELPAVSSTTPSCNGSESTLADCVAVPLDQSTDCDNVAVEVTCSRPVSATAPTSIAPSTSDSIPDGDSTSVDTDTRVPVSSTPRPSVEAISSRSSVPAALAITSTLPSTHALLKTNLPRPADSEESDPILSPVYLGAVGAGLVLIIVVLIGIVVMWVLVVKRSRKTKVSSTSARTAELEKKSGRGLQQLGWPNPLAMVDSGPYYTEVSLSSPNTPLSATTAPFNHALTPGSSVSDSSHEYEELQESISKAREYKRTVLQAAQRANAADSPGPYQLPECAPAQEPMYSTLTQEGAYQTLQPCITSSPQLEEKPVLPPRDQMMYAHLDHGKGFTFKPERRNHYSTEGVTDRVRSASLDNHLRRDSRNGKEPRRGGGQTEGEKRPATLDSHQRRHKRRKEQGKDRRQDDARQYQNVRPSSRHELEEQHSEMRVERSATLPSAAWTEESLSADDNKRSSLV